MNIFESLENLNVSEECFNDIMDIVEDIVTGYYTDENGEKHRDVAIKNKVRRATSYYTDENGEKHRDVAMTQDIK